MEIKVLREKTNKTNKTNMTTHFVMLVKDTLKKEVSVVVKLRGAVWRDLYPGIKRRNKNIRFGEFAAFWFYSGTCFFLHFLL